MTLLSILDIAVPRFKHTHKHGETFQTFLRLRCKSRLPILLRSRLSSLPEACWDLLLSCLSWCGIGLGWGDNVSALQTVRWFGLRNCFLVSEERKKERKKGRMKERRKEGNEKNNLLDKIENSTDVGFVKYIPKIQENISRSFVDRVYSVFHAVGFFQCRSKRYTTVEYLPGYIVVL